MKVIKERIKPKGKPIPVVVNNLPPKNSLTIKPESCILKEDNNEPKNDRTQETSKVKEERSVQEVRRVPTQPKSKDGIRLNTKPRRNKRSRTKSKK